MVFDSPCHGQLDVVQGRRLGNIAPGAAANGQFRAVRIARCGENDHFGFVFAAADTGQGFQAVAVRQADVQNDDIKNPLPGQIKPLYQKIGALHLVPHGGYHHCQGLAELNVVVNDQDMGHGLLSVVPAIS